MSIFLVDSYSESNYSELTLTEILRPNADGDVIELYNNNYTQVNNWSYVDEVVADDWTTYLYNPSTGIKLDLYNLPAHSGSGIINKITVYIRINTELSASYIRIAIKTGGANFYSGNLTTYLGDYEFVDKSYEWETNPDTETTWTWDDIDNLQIGLECKGLETYCTQLYVGGDYTPNILYSG